MQVFPGIASSWAPEIWNNQQQNLDYNISKILKQGNSILLIDSIEKIYFLPNGELSADWICFSRSATVMTQKSISFEVHPSMGIWIVRCRPHSIALNKGFPVPRSMLMPDKLQFVIY
jgi:hypothetical protein